MYEHSPGSVELSSSRAAALYMHVPFCASKCGYCDFYSLVFNRDLADGFVRAAAAELSAGAEGLFVPLESVFIGGGTPTVLGAELLEALLRGVGPLIADDTEFTVEANPEPLGPSIPELLVAGGVNRVNLGVQSFREDELRVLGRMHSPSAAGRAVAALRKAGIVNVAVDLIYGIPNQTMASWLDSLDKAIQLGIDHLSCYCLSFEPGTPLGADLAAGRLREMPEQLQRDCYYAAIEVAARAGLEHYEKSNFARPGRRCRHNLTYWHNRPYLGVGPGAASYIGGVRRMNLPDLEQYVRAILNGRPCPASAERLTGRAAMAETLMLALRLTEGADRPAITARFGADPVDAFASSIGRYAKAAALEISDARIRISRRALFVADSILADIVAEA